VRSSPPSAGLGGGRNLGRHRAETKGIDDPSPDRPGAASLLEFHRQDTGQGGERKPKKPAQTAEVKCRAAERARVGDGDSPPRAGVPLTVLATSQLTRTEKGVRPRRHLRRGRKANELGQFNHQSSTRLEDATTRWT